MDCQKQWRNITWSLVFLGAFAIAVAVVSYFADYNNLKTSKNFEVLHIGIVDGLRLKQEAKCFEAHKNVAEKVTKVLAVIREDSEKMKKQMDEIKKNKKLNEKQRRLKLNALDIKWRDKAKLYNEKMRAIKDLDKKLVSFIQDKLLQLIGDIAKKEKIDIVLNKCTIDTIHIFYNRKAIDMTDIVIDKLNNTMPTIDLKELDK